MVETTSGSRVRVDEGRCTYPESPQESWGQPSAARYVFEVVGHTLYGQFVSGVYISSYPSASPDQVLGCDEEPEDALLVESGILPQLIARARQEPASANWEQDLAEM